MPAPARRAAFAAFSWTHGQRHGARVRSHATVRAVRARSTVRGRTIELDHRQARRRRAREPVGPAEQPGHAARVPLPLAPAQRLAGGRLRSAGPRDRAGRRRRHERLHPLLRADGLGEDLHDGRRHPQLRTPRHRAASGRARLLRGQRPPRDGDARELHVRGDLQRAHLRPPRGPCARRRRRGADRSHRRGRPEREGHLRAGPARGRCGQRGGGAQPLLLRGARAHDCQQPAEREFEPEPLRLHALHRAAAAERRVGARPDLQALPRRPRGERAAQEDPRRRGRRRRRRRDAPEGVPVHQPEPHVPRAVRGGARAPRGPCAVPAVEAHERPEGQPRRQRAHAHVRLHLGRGGAAGGDGVHAAPRLAHDAREEQDERRRGARPGRPHQVAAAPDQGAAAGAAHARCARGAQRRRVWRLHAGAEGGRPAPGAPLHRGRLRGGRARRAAPEERSPHVRDLPAVQGAHPGYRRRPDGLGAGRQRRGRRERRG